MTRVLNNVKPVLMLGGGISSLLCAWYTVKTLKVRNEKIANENLTFVTPNTRNLRLTLRKGISKCFKIFHKVI